MWAISESLKMFINDQVNVIELISSSENEFYYPFCDWRKQWPLKMRVENYDLFYVYCGC